MAHNFLEQMVAEWYEYNEYFVRRNVWVGLRKKGGYEGELDIIAFNPTKRHLLQVETSMDASSWSERERRFKKKFDAGRRFIPSLFKGLDIPKEIEQIALLVFASKKNRDTIGGGRIVLMSEFLSEVFSLLVSKSIYSRAISEQFTILRSLQFVAEYRDSICSALQSGTRISKRGTPE